MKCLSQKIKKGFIYLLLSITFLNCRKTSDALPPDQTDPLTGAPVTAIAATGGSCYIIKIAQRNQNFSGGTDNDFEIIRDTAFVPNRFLFYDSLSGTQVADIKIRTVRDSVLLSTGEYFLQNPTSKLIESFSTKSDLTDPQSDIILYQYVYNSSGYLAKKYIYYNDDPSPTYETNYSYTSDSILIGCTIYVGSNHSKFLESKIDFDLNKPVKPWLYLFPDFFEGYNYLQAFNFGKRTNFALKNILTKIYDVNDGTLIDTWNTSFSDHVISKDGYLLQTTANGDQQQGLGLLFGITRFDYQCSK